MRDERYVPFFGAFAAWDYAGAGGTGGRNGRGADLPRTRWGAGGREIGDVAIHQRRAAEPRRLAFSR
jgi:hypothetical protein